MGCGLDDWDLMAGWGTDFSVCHNIQVCSGAHPTPLQWILEVLSLGGRTAEA
jgi:hypothetical protein